MPTNTPAWHGQESWLDDLKLVAVGALVLGPLLPIPLSPTALAVSWSIGCVLLAALIRPRLEPLVDGPLVLVIAWTAAQLIPVPHALAYVVRGGDPSLAGSPLSLQPLTHDVGATARGLLYTAGGVSLFVSTREQLGSGGTRRLARALIATGLFVAVLTIVEELAAAIAGLDAPRAALIRVFPTRDHSATWLIMILPLCVGYAIAHTRAHRSQASSRRALLGLAGSRSGWLFPAAAAISLAVVVSLSHSAAFALAIVGLTTMGLVRRHLDPGGRGWLMAGIAAGLVASVSLATLTYTRLPSAGTEAGSASGWSFRLSSPGSGAEASHGSDGAAHQRGHYARLARDGGPLPLVLWLLAGAAVGRAGWTRLTQDTSGIRWLRVGSACGLAAVALQSAVADGLRAPPNAALGAVLAAILVHRWQAGEQDASNVSTHGRRSARAGIRADPRASPTEALIAAAPGLSRRRAGAPRVR